MTQEHFRNLVDWIDFIYGVPGTYWGERSPNKCKVESSSSSEQHCNCPPTTPTPNNYSHPHSLPMETVTPDEFITQRFGRPS
ncbi:hypothetical protein [Bacillus cereus]|uniref:hypothetical protein n=1 Tax=Bacillus cereus TaxID=1396 RepID=UPI0015D4A011|nr:hypothetical protein [Bacillus cereus]